MKFSLPGVLTACAAAALALAGSSARLLASPMQAAPETLRVAPRTGDHARAADRADVVADSLRLAVAANAVPEHLREFAARQKRGIGRFITDSVLRSEETLSLSTVLRTHILGLGRAMDARTSMGIGPADRCSLDVYLNGTHVTGPIDDIRTSELAGVEYYDRVSAPIQYRRSGTPCEVLLLWTR